jgi:hypothetical protein
MIADLNLIMATAEAVPNAGAAPGGLGGNTITGGAPYFIDMLQADNPLGDGIDQVAVSKLELNVTITTSFPEGTIAGVTYGPHGMAEFQLVSLPINPLLLSNATTSGKLISGSFSSTVGTNLFTTSAAHNMPLGTPVYISALGVTTGPVLNKLYYVIPLSATTFQIASTLANALAGTAVPLGGEDSSVVFQFFPMVHVTTGMLWSSWLKAGAQFVGRTVPGAVNGGGDHVAPYAGADALPLGVQTQPGTGLGGGGGTAIVAAPGRYLLPRVFVFNANVGTTGRYSMALGVDAGLGQRHFPVGSQIKSR